MVGIIEMGNFDPLSFAFSIILAIISAIVSWAVARRTTLKTELTAIIDSTTIFKDEIFPNVMIEVNGKRSEVLTKSVVVLWNSGFSTIYSRDIVESNPLRIELPLNTQFYAAEIETTTDEDMKFDIKVSNTCLTIKFDHCKRGEGIRIAVLHNGDNASFEGKLKTAGTIKAYYKYGRDTFSKKKDRLKIRYRMPLLVASIILYEILVIALGFTVLLALSSVSEAGALLLGMGVCVCGGCSSNAVFQFLQNAIISEDGPPTLWY